MKARLHIDWTRCDGHGSCAELLPGVLDTDDWGFPIARSGEKEPTIRAHDAAAASHAVRSCPVMALRLMRMPGQRPRPR